MAVDLFVRADIVDVRNYIPKKDDVFLVDTNVWFWMTYSQTSRKLNSYQVIRYPDFAKKALTNKAILKRLDLSFSELAHSIESIEFKKVKSILNCSRKEYRHNHPQERQNVVNEVASSWRQVCTMSSSVEFILSQDIVQKATKTFMNYPLDGYDLFFIEVLKDNEINGVLTDDMDFACYPGIKMFTANDRVVSAALSQNRLKAN